MLRKLSIVKMIPKPSSALTGKELEKLLPQCIYPIISSHKLDNKLEGLLSKFKHILSTTYYHFLKSYLTDGYFRVSQGSDLSTYLPVRAGVPQGSILSPFLYTL